MQVTGAKITDLQVHRERFSLRIAFTLNLTISLNGATYHAPVPVKLPRIGFKGIALWFKERTG